MPPPQRRPRFWLSVLLTLLWVAVLGAWAASTAMAQDRQAPARRIAFVVGNANYQNETPLKNPHNDVALLARTLRGPDLGFRIARSLK